MSSMNIRAIKPSEINQIIAMDHDIFGRYGGEESPDVIRARIEIFPAGCALLEVNKEAGIEIAGYFTTEKWHSLNEPTLNQDPRQSHKPQGEILNITTLAISDRHQGSGQGGLLLNRIEEIAQAEGCHTIILETAHAERFYKKHGYVRVGERNERGYPLYIMIKDFRKS